MGLCSLTVSVIFLLAFLTLLKLFVCPLGVSQVCSTWLIPLSTVSSLFSKTDIISNIASSIAFRLFYSSSISCTFSVNWLCSIQKMQKLAWHLWNEKRTPERVNQLKWKKIEEQGIGVVCFNSATSCKSQLREVCVSFHFQDKVLFSLCLTIHLPRGWCWLFSVSPSLPLSDSLSLSSPLLILEARAFHSKAVFANSFCMWTLSSSSLLGWLKLYLTWRVSWKKISESISQ